MPAPEQKLPPGVTVSAVEPTSGNAVPLKAVPVMVADTPAAAPPLADCAQKPTEYPTTWRFVGDQLATETAWPLVLKTAFAVAGA